MTNGPAIDCHSARANHAASVGALAAALARRLDVALAQGLVGVERNCGRSFSNKKSKNQSKKALNRWGTP